MSRAQFDQAAQEALAQCVKEIEQNTDAELVIVVRARSGNYRHSDYLFGALIALAGLVGLIFLPIDFHHQWVPVDVAVLFVIGAFLSSRINAIRRLFTSKKFREEVARAGAAAMFYEAGIANTDAEMGVLVYLSLLERRLELIADRGVLKAVPSLQWNQTLFELQQVGYQPGLKPLLKALREMGALFATHLPATGENPNELPDLPRFEL